MVLLTRGLCGSVTGCMGERSVCVYPGNVPGSYGRRLGTEQGGRIPRLLFLSGLLVDGNMAMLLSTLGVLGRGRCAFIYRFINKRASRVNTMRFSRRISGQGLGSEVTCINQGMKRRGRTFFERSSIFIFPACCCGRYFPLIVLRTVRCGLPIVSAGRNNVPSVIGSKRGNLVYRGRGPISLTSYVTGLLSSRRLEIGVKDTNRRGFYQRFALSGFRGEVESVLGRGLFSS